MQCKDIPDIPVLEFLARLARKEITHTYSTSNGLAQSFQPTSSTLHGGYPHCIQNAMPEEVQFNEKLVKAKMRGLIGRGLVRGCACGCRGDFELTDKGRQFIAAKPAE